jgi:lycopene cyclase domain-containing protein
MATYLILNVLFMVAIVLWLRIPIRIPSKKRVAALAMLLILTIVFDSLLVGVGIVGYDTAKIMNVYIGNAPVEDFFYSLLAIIIIPFLWKKFERK